MQANLQWRSSTVMTKLTNPAYWSAVVLKSAEIGGICISLYDLLQFCRPFTNRLTVSSSV